MKPIRVLLVDDHALFREGLAGIIANQIDMEVIGEANDGLEGIVMASELQPDLVLMDIQMPGCDGIEATQKIVEQNPDVVIIMLTVRNDDKMLFEAVKKGAKGYILKSIRSREMLEMLRGAMRGEAAISPSMAGYLLDEFRRMSRQMPHELDDESADLTPREQEVLRHVMRGKSDKEIAKSLNISLNTVKSHVRNILAKFQVSSRREAARLARHKGLV